MVHVPHWPGTGSICQANPSFITRIIIILLVLTREKKISNDFFKYVSLTIIHIKGKINFFIFYYVLSTIN
jgi:hypothetical protein